MSDSPTRPKKTGTPARLAIPPPAPGAPPVDILIVDDRTPELDALEAVLAQPGYNVARAQSGTDALRLLLKKEFAVILLDIHMPDMDGFQVATIIKERERSRHTPIIFLTATHDDIGAIYRAYKIGAVDYLTKPFDEMVVRTKVAVFAELYRKEQRIQQQAEALREMDRRAKERELREMKALSERRYRALVESVPACVITADATGRFTYCNKHWIEMTGLDLATSRKAWLAVVHPDDRDRAGDGWRGAVATGQPIHDEIRLQGRDGKFRWHAVDGVPERGPDGRVRGWLAMMFDCEDLKRAVQLRDEFLSIASHELKTPLTTMMLQLEAALRGGRATVDARTGDRMTAAVRQAQRLNALIENLLDVGRITSGKLHLNLERCDLSETVKEAIARFEEEAVRAGSTLALVAEENVTAEVDPVRVDQVVGNLLSNALKYGRGRPVLVRVRSVNGLARLEVQDQGIGIAPEDRERIFRRFERAVSPDHYAGLGVGLFVTRQIVEAHGGKIDVESVQGDGATFTVSLPRKAAAE